MEMRILMESKLLLSTTILLLFLLLISNHGLVMEAEAAMCSKPSKLYEGPCIFRDACRFVCNDEGWPDGRCTKIFGKCICYKPCMP
nr:defensin NsD7-like [Coffea arabica]